MKKVCLALVFKARSSSPWATGELERRRGLAHGARSPAYYHTTVPQRARSFQGALEMLHLTGDTEDLALWLRDAILLNLYPELDDRELENRFKAQRLLGRTCRTLPTGQVQERKRERELQGIEMPTWYFLYWSDEHQGLRPFNPQEAELTPEDADKSPYVVVGPVPNCAVWNLLDNEQRLERLH